MRLKGCLGIILVFQLMISKEALSVSSAQGRSSGFMMRGNINNVAGNQAIMQSADSASAGDLEAVAVHLVISNHLVSEILSPHKGYLLHISYEGGSYLEIFLNLPLNHLLQFFRMSATQTLISELSICTSQTSCHVR